MGINSYDRHYRQPTASGQWRIHLYHAVGQLSTGRVRGMGGRHMPPLRCHTRPPCVSRGPSEPRAARPQSQPPVRLSTSLPSLLMSSWSHLPTRKSPVVWSWARLTMARTPTQGSLRGRGAGRDRRHQARESGRTFGMTRGAACGFSLRGRTSSDST
jgi:hypothetical protein